MPILRSERPRRRLSNGATDLAADLPLHAKALSWSPSVLELDRAALQATFLAAVLLKLERIPKADGRHHVDLVFKGPPRQVRVAGRGHGPVVDVQLGV